VLWPTETNKKANSADSATLLGRKSDGNQGLAVEGQKKEGGSEEEFENRKKKTWGEGPTQADDSYERKDRHSSKRERRGRRNLWETSSPWRGKIGEKKLTSLFPLTAASPRRNGLKRTLAGGKHEDQDDCD